jgi:hypothetical protein
MAKSHKAQHWIPRSYLQAWTEPDVPANHEPFVHVFSKDGDRHRRRAPSNIFTETDLYTIKQPGGGRDLRLEHGLSELETAFAAIRKDFLARRRQLPSPRRLRLMAFLAAMQARTPSLRNHHMTFWKEVLDAGENIERRMKTAIGEEKKRAAVLNPPRSEGDSMTMEDVRRVISSPMEHTLVPHITAQLPFLMLMRCRVLCAANEPGFITSDAPVVWFDPEWHRKPPLFRSPSLSEPLLEITLPISPRQMLVITHQLAVPADLGIDYIDVLEHHVDELNRRTRFRCDKEFVVQREITRPRWFERGTMPADAWEAIRGKPDPIDKNTDTEPI